MSESLRWLPPEFDTAAAMRYRRPIHSFIVKVASRCNLDCSYCYVYQSPDKSWKEKPTFLALGTAGMIAARIQEHVLVHEIPDVSIVFHGGEPLLAGLGRLSAYADVFLSTITCPIQFGMQTNGSLLDEDAVDFLVRYQCRIGISLDGTREHNDRNRNYHNGRSSYDDVLRSIRLLRSREEYQGVLGGLLVVIDVRNRPEEILEVIDSLGVKGANLLLPDSNHASPPFRPDDDSAIYGKWLVEFFDIWIDRYSHIEVPYFEEIINLMLGGVSSSEEIGALSVDFLVIDTNGEMEAVDTLKMVGRSATSLGLSVNSNRIDDALGHPAIYSRMAGHHALCVTCRQCSFVHNCAGGYLPHRYSLENGFVNPSVYCQDLKYLFEHMKTQIFSSEIVGRD